MAEGLSAENYADQMEDQKFRMLKHEMQKRKEKTEHILRQHKTSQCEEEIYTIFCTSNRTAAATRKATPQPRNEEVLEGIKMEFLFLSFQAELVRWLYGWLG